MNTKLKKLALIKDAIFILPDDRVRVSTSDGTRFFFRYALPGKWHEYLAVPGQGTVTGEARQEAWEKMRAFIDLGCPS